MCLCPEHWVCFFFTCVYMFNCMCVLWAISVCHLTYCNFGCLGHCILAKISSRPTCQDAEHYALRVAVSHDGSSLVDCWRFRGSARVAIALRA